MLVWITIATCWFAMGTFVVALCRAAAYADSVMTVT
jgi:hypothetical protein